MRQISLGFKYKLAASILLLTTGMPALASAVDSASELPEPSTMGLFVAAAIAITLLGKLKK